MLSTELWQAHQDIARECLDHPFVRGIATGTLDRDRFAFYVGQDAFFLESFARSYSIAAAKAPDWKGFRVFQRLATGVLEELQLHETYALRWGVDLRTVRPAPATRHYTDFLLATAWAKDPGAIAVAMSPCMRLYAFLGRELAGERISENPYQDWIDTYSSSEFEELACELERLVDKYAVSGEESYSSYRYALDRERDFFEAAIERGEP
ncbi:TenA family protein [Pannus brasiliensis CCIBt3594]|uniref:TenA family protein n=1 Tax=Pannus brasiliensis CCIBt3594 TaxID=1427578 RepID=A0AAW9QT82_9CHRO